jgi:paraquat-inducible protein B
MTWHALKILAIAALVGISAAATSAANRERRERPGHGMEVDRIEQNIRAGRSVVKRVERDPRASAEIKQKATHLDQLLDARERTLAKLDAQHRDFVSQHKADLDALDDLRQRALAIDEKLDQARTALMQANKADIDELKRTSQEARELVETLRSSYELDRRMRHH